MNTSAFYNSFYASIIDRVFFTPGTEEYPAFRNVAAQLGGLPWQCISDPDAIPPQHRNQKSLLLQTFRGEPVTRCPGTRFHRCCNYRTVDTFIGCSIGCTYCIMQSYLNFRPLVVQVDPAPAIEAMRQTAAHLPVLRIGTGEVGDSLLLDPLTGISQEFIRAAAEFPNIHFELKTKTDFVDHLLNVAPKGNAVIGFSVNPPSIIAQEEGIAASLERRLQAAEQAVAAGYRVAFHFDPMIRVADWYTLYRQLAERLTAFAPSQVAWISLGTVRFTPDLYRRMPDRSYLYDEFVTAKDGKLRYLQPLRVQMYRAVADILSPRYPVYLCMESDAVWQRVFGAVPGEMPTLRDIFADRSFTGRARRVV